MNVTDYLCSRCKKECDILEDLDIDLEPYGDRMVERRSYTCSSACCGAEVDIVRGDETIH